MLFYSQCHPPPVPFISALSRSKSEVLMSVIFYAFYFWWFLYKPGRNLILLHTCWNLWNLFLFLPRNSGRLTWFYDVNFGATFVFTFGGQEQRYDAIMQDFYSVCCLFFVWLPLLNTMDQDGVLLVSVGILISYIPLNKNVLSSGDLS